MMNFTTYELELKLFRCFANVKYCLPKNKGFTSLVGTNNSGKTALLKFFHELRPIFLLLSNPDSLEKLLKGDESQTKFGNFVRDPKEVFSNFSKGDLEINIHITNFTNNINKDLTVKNLIVNLSRQGKLSTYVLFNDGLSSKMKEKIIIGNSHFFESGEPRLALTQIADIFKSFEKTFYVPSFRHILQLGNTSADDTSYFDIKVGQDFIRYWRDSKTGTDKGARDGIYKLTQHIKDIFDYDDLSIDAAKDLDTLYVRIDGKDYSLYEMGSGFAQILLILANVYRSKPSYILIDEPELNLHPYLQLKFLSKLGEYASIGTLFSTHNIGLARSIGSDIFSIVKRKGENSKLSRFDSNPGLPQLLGEMSFSTYQEIGFNKILLVEGVSELTAIRVLLRKYKKDHEIMLLSLGGSDLINGKRKLELQEMKRICNDVYALIDSEKKSENDDLGDSRKEFVQICHDLNIKCHVLERRAIENYWTDVAIKRVKIGGKFRELLPYEEFKKTKELDCWAKEENSRIAEEMDIEDINNNDLGIFLQSIVVGSRNET